jgi:hypothetical protein
MGQHSSLVYQEGELGRQLQERFAFRGDNSLRWFAVSCSSLPVPSDKMGAYYMSALSNLEL